MYNLCLVMINCYIDSALCPLYQMGKHIEWNQNITMKDFFKTQNNFIKSCYCWSRERMKRILNWMGKVNRETYSEALSLRARVWYNYKSKDMLNVWIRVKE